MRMGAQSFGLPTIAVAAKGISGRRKQSGVAVKYQ